MPKLIKENDGKLTIRLPQEDINLLKEIAKENKISVGSIIRTAIKDFMADSFYFWERR